MAATLIKGLTTEGIVWSANTQIGLNFISLIKDKKCIKCGLKVKIEEYDHINTRYCNCEPLQYVSGIAKSVSKAVTTTVATKAGLTSAGVVVKGISGATKSVFLIGDAAEIGTNYLLGKTDLDEDDKTALSTGVGFCFYVGIGVASVGPVGAVVGAGIYGISKGIQSLVSYLFS